MTTETAPAPKKKSFKGVVVVNHENCKGCAFCVEFCPLEALSLEDGYNAKGYHPPYLSKPEKCNGCDMCGLYCPDFAIFGYREKLDGAGAA
jgi:2-oxoglutarate ferredoxin oxidoreductase subunit delta